MNRVPQERLPMAQAEYREKLERLRHLRSEMGGKALGGAVQRWAEACRVTTLLRLQLADAVGREQGLFDEMEAARATASPLVKRLDAQIRELGAEIESERALRKELGL